MVFFETIAGPRCGNRLLSNRLLKNVLYSNERILLFKSMDRSKCKKLLNKRLSILLFLSGFFTIPVLVLAYVYLFYYFSSCVYYKLFWRVERAQYHNEERMRNYFVDNYQEFEEMENLFLEDRGWRFSVERVNDSGVFIHGDEDKIALYGIRGRYLEYRVYLGRYSEDGGEIISYLYLPEVKFNEEDFVHIENLEGDWYFAIYNYQPIKRKYTE